jgi:regulator of replication initiation timing
MDENEKLKKENETLKKKLAEVEAAKAKEAVNICKFKECMGETQERNCQIM